MTALLILLIAAVPCDVFGRSSASIRRQALERELQIARSAPDRYYLVADLFADTVQLKAAGRVLHEAAVIGAETTRLEDPFIELTHRETIPPHTPVAGAVGGRLGGRRLPLDFVGRLIEGPRRHDRLYFSPALLMGSPRAPVPDGMPVIRVSGEDIKSFSSAVEPGTVLLIIHPAAP